MVFDMVSNFMNRLKWTEKLPQSEVVILHRGAPGDRKNIMGDQITEIKRDHFCYLDFDNSEETYIPMHRVLEIWMQKNLVWKKRPKPPVPPKPRNGNGRNGAGNGKNRYAGKKTKNRARKAAPARRPNRKLSSRRR